SVPTVGVKRTNPTHVLGAQLRATAQFPVSVAPLANHVCYVIGVSSKEQMSRVHARPYIASVQNEHTRRHRTLVNHPRNPVRMDRMPQSYCASVSIRCEPPEPYPTAGHRL